MTEPIRITVAWDAYKLHKNQRLNPVVRRKLARQSKLVAQAAYRNAGSPRLTVPVVVQAIIRRGKALDQDAALSGVSGIIDQIFCRRRSLTNEGVSHDDSPKFVTWLPVKQEIGKEFKGNEEIEFLIWPQEEEASNDAERA